MQDRVYTRINTDLIVHWAIFAVMFALVISILLACQWMGTELQQPLPEAERIGRRTLFYIITILSFPLTNLIRHIQLRLDQTMPLPPTPTGKEARNRYLVTVLVSMVIMASLGFFGLFMFKVGDHFNTLYIFTGLSALGLILYRPKMSEYTQITDALAAKPHE
jgi:hypothetical protein